MNNAEKIAKEILKKQKKQESKEKKEKSVHRLGKHKFVPEPTPFQLSDEITDSLRTLKTEGNLFVDRFKSLQERCIIEPRVPVTKKRRYKLKVYEKRSYKNFK